MSFGMAYMTKKHNKKMAKGGAACMAEGGEVHSGKQRADNEKGVHKEIVPGSKTGMSSAGAFARTQTRYTRGEAGTSPRAGLAAQGHVAKEHDRVRAEQKAMPGPTSGMSGFAAGGFVDDEMGEYDPTEMPMPKDNESANMEDADMIARIMHKRKEYSQGGMVANDTPPIADSMPADFDDLALRDELDGAQPEDSNEHGDADVSDDPVDRLMMKRKKDKLPRPA